MGTPTTKSSPPTDCQQLLVCSQKRRESTIASSTLEHPEHDQGGLKHDQGDCPEHGWGSSPSSSTFIKFAYKNGGQEDQRISRGEWVIFAGCSGDSCKSDPPQTCCCHRPGGVSELFVTVVGKWAPVKSGGMINN
jgi:hypothetical protein